MYLRGVEQKERREERRQDESQGEEKRENNTKADERRRQEKRGEKERRKRRGEERTGEERATIFFLVINRRANTEGLGRVGAFFAVAIHPSVPAIANSSWRESAIGWAPAISGARLGGEEDISGGEA